MNYDLSDDFARAFDDLPSSVPDNLLEGLTSASTALSADIAAREWIWDDIIPAGATTLLTGSGGDGKSLLAKMVATHVAAGEPLFGRDVTRCNVLALYGEDDIDELLRRQKSILRESAIEPSDVEQYRFKSLFGCDTLLGSFDRATSAFVPSVLFDAIRATAIHQGARLVILDNVTQMFCGDVNDRGQVTRFLQCLNRLALEINGAVLLLAHVAKSEGSTYAGTTAWRDGVRQALMIERPERVNVMLDRMSPGAERTIRTTKSNYGGTAKISVYWERGCFKLVEGSHAAISHSLAHDEHDFLAALMQLEARQIAVSHHANATNYAPRTMETELGLKRGKMVRALDSLLADGRLDLRADLGWSRPNRTAATGLKLLDDQSAPDDHRSKMAMAPTAQHIMDQIKMRIPV